MSAIDKIVCTLPGTVAGLLSCLIAVTAPLSVQAMDSDTRVAGEVREQEDGTDESLGREDDSDASGAFRSVMRRDGDPDALYSRDALYLPSESREDLAETVEQQRAEDLSYDVAYAFLDDANLPKLLGWWTLWNQPFNRQPFDWKAYCDSSVNGIDQNGGVLQCWLNLNPDVKEAMIWQEVDLVGDVTLLDYDQWDGFMKTYLDVHFHNYYQWLDSSATNFPAPELPDPLVNQEQLADGQPAVTAMVRMQAVVLYLQNVAHSLALEIGGFVPWSLRHYYQDELEMLLSSESFFRAGNYSSAHVDNPVPVDFTGYWPIEVTPAPPTTSFAFMVQQNLLRPSHYDTISRLLKWGREHMYHYHGGRTADNMDNHWDYRGAPPVARMIDGTYKKSPASSKLQSWAAGCHGTSFFFREVLRSANIPVKPTWLPVTGKSGGHRAPVFTTINRMLSHGDDVYGVRFNIPSVDPDYVAPDSLLIHQDKLLYWFNLASNPDAGKNVGRQVREIALQVLPDKLMEKYCDDIQGGLTHSQGSVAEFFSRNYTVQQLEAKSLWYRLAQKNWNYGFCPSAFQIIDAVDPGWIGTP